MENKTIRTEEQKKALKNRLARIKGQIDGIMKMVDEDRYCNDILIQLIAVSSGAKSLANILLEQHLRSCVLGKLNTKNEDVVEEVLELFKRI